MSNDRIKELFEKHAQTLMMSQLRFTSALREALAEEMAEAARLLDHTTAWASGHDRSCPFCRAAARFVAEHGKTNPLP